MIRVYRGVFLRPIPPLTPHLIADMLPFGSHAASWEECEATSIEDGALTHTSEHDLPQVTMQRMPRQEDDVLV
jgi:hypothetical protein